jgi:DNA uptake protein ComE-like DNA-binding protein
VLLIPVDAPNDMDEQESYVETIQKDVSTWNTDVEHHHHHSTTLLSLALPNTTKNQDRDDGAKEKRSFHETRSHESSRVHKKSSEPRTDNVTELPPTVDKSYNFMTTIHDLVDKIQREQAETAHLEQECLQMEREYHEILQTVTDYLESMKQKKEAMESKNAQLKQTLLGLQVARSQLLEQMPTTTPGAMCE